MGVSPIPGTQGGDGHPLAVWSYSNKSTLLRFGALVALSNVTGSAPCDILTFGEIKAPSAAPAMVLIGVCSMAGPENSLTNPLTVDGTGVTNTPVTSIGRHKLILSPGQTVTQANPYLMPDSAVPGNVVVWNDGSGCAPVARALDFPALSGSEQYIEGELLPGIQGLSAVPGDLAIGDATDAVVSGRYVPRAGLHTAPATAPETPVVYVSRGLNWVSALGARLATAPGAGNGVRYEFKVGATPQGANAAAASSAVDILGTSTVGTLVSGQPAGFWMTDNSVLVVKAIAQGAGVGTALHSTVSFRAQ